MPKSMGRRVELLEADPTRRRPDPEPAEVLLDWLEGVARQGFAGLPPGLASALAAHWAAYVPVRDALLAAPEEPPDNYSTHLPRGRRTRPWLRFDHPNLRAAV